MPIFEYRCLKCKNDFDELIRNTADEESVVCPKCGSRRVRKQMSAFGVQGAVSKTISSASGGSSCSSCSTHSCSTCGR